MRGAGSQYVQPGIVQAGDCRILKGQSRVLVLSHAAAVTPCGANTVDWLRESGYGTVIGVMGPEHGFLGHAAAGVPCRTFQHPVWRVPVYSLYGKNRVPQRAWLQKADVLLIDLQDLGYRPYTYLSSMYYALRAAAASGVPVVVADRPIPLPRTVDGPMLDPDFASFVGAVPVPLCYGMTPGETARWIQQQLLPALLLEVLPMQGFRRSQTGFAGVRPWISPSPAIRSAETAIVYPATVGLEGLAQIDHGRHTTMPFQLVGAPWIEPEIVSNLLQQLQLPGVQFHPHVYVPHPETKPLPGIRIAVVDPKVFRPVQVMVHMLHTLTLRYGRRRIWQNRQCRPAFFDKLMGTDRVRLALMKGEAPAAIVNEWQPSSFKRQRESALLYS